MSVNNVYTYDPIEYNKLNQAQKWYPGIDKVENYILKKGTILVALEGPRAGAGGNYFMPLEDFKNGNLDSINLCQGLQVNPYYDYQNENSQPQYKTNARFYVINEEILSAEGVISANTNYGKGGLQQIVVPNGSEMIKEAYRNNEHSLNDTIIPIDLNKFENDERLSGKTKEELDSVRNKFSYNLSDDGSIYLNNKVISEEAYRLIQNRTEIHELTVANNCLLKEYTDELQKKDKDINYICKIKSSIDDNDNDLQVDKEYLMEKKESFDKHSILNEFTDDQKEHILNTDTCCPKETLKKSEYLKAKASELEKNLSYDEKKLLNIEDDVSSDKLNNFKENTKLEEGIKEDYENYTRIDPEGIVNRKLIYTPIEKDKNEDTDGRRTALGEKDQLYEENLNKNDMTSLELSSDNKVYIENDEIKVIDEAAASEVSEEDSDLKDVNENLEENQNCEDENSETSKTADDNKDMSILESTQTEKDQQAETDIEASTENTNNTEVEIDREEKNKNKLESREEFSEEIDYKNIKEDENLEVDAQQSSIEGQITSEKQDENLEINKELDNNGAEGKIEGNLEKNETMDQDENSNKNDNISLELGSYNTMDSKKVLSQMEEQSIDENEVINSEEALEKVQNQNYLNNEETENNKVLEENLVNDSKVDIENDEIKVRYEAAASEASEEDSVLKDANENLEQNQDCEDENFETSETADDNNDMLSFDDNLEKLDNENCDENEKLKDCDEEAIESSVNCNGTTSCDESDEDLDEDEDEFYDY